MRNRHQRWTAPFATVALLIALASADVRLRAGVDEDEIAADTLIQRVVTETTRAGLAIRATRELQAATISGKHHGWMTVETVQTPAGAFSWRVTAEGGSDRTRDKVFRTMLESEAESFHDGSRTDAALTPENYVFTILPTTRGNEVQIRLLPRRRDTRLVDGVLTVSPDGHPLRLEGKLAKSPSFWVKSVTIRKRYGRFAGVALPTLFESEADLKIVGKSRLTMRYHYREVNGRPVLSASNTAGLEP